MSRDSEIIAVECEPWSLELNEPFGIATGVQARADNVLVFVRLRDGSRGTGEAAPFPAVNGETQAQALSDLRAFRSLDAMTCKSAQCAVEMALLDAELRARGQPMWRYFGGAGTQLEIDHTITTGADPGAAAARIAAMGFTTIKLKVGAGDDEKRLQAVIAAAPHCQLILDGNCGLANADAALALVTPQTVLLEQPLPREAFDETRRLYDRTRVKIAADESVTRLQDVQFIAEHKLAHVVNLKIMKSGLFASHAMALEAKRLGLGLMIGAMVESPLALTVSACLAAGVGGFAFADLDTHMFMKAPGTQGGFTQAGRVLTLDGITAGHGVSLAASE